jgi:hypothetical protein
MTEIAHIFESTLRQNRASLLRRAAMNTVAQMPGHTTLRELLQSDAAEAIRGLTLRDLARALSSRIGTRGSRGTEVGADGRGLWPESREEQIYRRILEAVAESALTIGQIAKRVDIDTTELRGYLTWMKKMGKLTSRGRARSTRYSAAHPSE